jgi:hypothetical protein
MQNVINKDLEHPRAKRLGRLTADCVRVESVTRLRELVKSIELARGNFRAKPFKGM